MRKEKFGIHCFVSGKVQGVWYRAGTQQIANTLGLTGWARNLSDGRVEVVAFGNEQNLHKLHMWLKTGPEHAKVSEVSYEEIAEQVHERFSIR